MNKDFILGNTEYVSFNRNWQYFNILNTFLAWSSFADSKKFGVDLKSFVAVLEFLSVVDV